MYNLALFLSYPSASIYLFLSLCGSHLVLIRYEIFLITNISSIKDFVLLDTSSIDEFEKHSFNVSNACCASLLHSHTALTCLSFSNDHVI